MLTETKVNRLPIPTNQQISTALCADTGFKKFLEVFYMLKQNFQHVADKVNGHVEAIKQEEQRTSIDAIIPKYEDEIEGFWNTYKQSSQNSITRASILRQLEALLLKITTEIENCNHA